MTAPGSPPAPWRGRRVLPNVDRDRLRECVGGAQRCGPARAARCALGESGSPRRRSRSRARRADKRASDRPPARSEARSLAMLSPQPHYYRRNSVPPLPLMRDERLGYWLPEAGRSAGFPALRDDARGGRRRDRRRLCRPLDGVAPAAARPDARVVLLESRRLRRRAERPKRGVREPPLASLRGPARELRRARGCRGLRARRAAAVDRSGPGPRAAGPTSGFARAGT